MTNKIEKMLILDVKKMLKIDFDFNDDNESKIVIQTYNKCRLLSHLFHKAGLTEVHCNNEGLFEIITKCGYYNHDDVMNAFYEIKTHPEWIVEFIEKYLDNKFMMETTFKTVESST